MVPFGFRIDWRRASWPTSRSPCSVNATTDGVVRDPSALGITVAWPPSMVAITEFVVPRSMPTAFGMVVPPRLGAPLFPALPCGVYFDLISFPTGPRLAGLPICRRLTLRRRNPVGRGHAARRGLGAERVRRAGYGSACPASP